MHWRSCCESAIHVHGKPQAGIERHGSIITQHSHSIVHIFWTQHPPCDGQINCGRARRPGCADEGAHAAWSPAAAQVQRWHGRRRRGLRRWWELRRAEADAADASDGPASEPSLGALQACSGSSAAHPATRYATMPPTWWDAPNPCRPAQMFDPRPLLDFRPPAHKRKVALPYTGKPFNLAN